VSSLVVFIVGAIVFAITVYGTVMAGGIALGRVQDHEQDAPASAAASDRDRLASSRR
jgi:hypothetical protein